MQIFFFIFFSLYYNYSYNMYSCEILESCRQYSILFATLRRNNPLRFFAHFLFSITSFLKLSTSSHQSSESPCLCRYSSQTSAIGRNFTLSCIYKILVKFASSCNFFISAYGCKSAQRSALCIPLVIIIIAPLPQ